MNSYYEVNFTQSNFQVQAWKGDAFNFPAHWHEELEWVYVIQGELLVRVNNKDYLVTRGQSIFIGMNQVHQYFSQSPCEFYMMKFNIGLLEGLHLDLESYSSLLTLFHDTQYIDDEFGLEFRMAIGKKLEGITEETQGEETGYRYSVLAMMYSLMTTIRRNSKFMELGESLQVEQPKSPAIIYALSYIEKNYSKSISLDTIASEVHLSKSHFAKLFKEHTGMSFVVCLRGYRLQKSRELLIDERKWSITDISIQCGFNSIKTFNRLFAQAMGVSPSGYRKAFYEKK